MRVLIDGLLLGGKHSGVEHSIEGLVAALAQGAPQHEYTLLCTRDYAASGRSPVPVRAAPEWVRGRLARICYEQIMLPRQLSSHKDCDLLHAPGYVMPLAWRGPCVLTVYDLIALQFPHHCTRFNAWHYGFVLPRSLQKAAAVVVPTQEVRRSITARFGNLINKVKVIPLGVGDQYRPAGDEQVALLRERLGLPQHFLLCVGNLEPKKNLPAVIRAFDLAARHLKQDLVLAGQPAWGTEAVTAVIACAQHRERIHRLGYVADADMPALYTAADLLVQWSLYEGMGLPPLEAMACGTPVVISDGGALPEVAGPAAEIVPLGPPEALAQALQTLLAAPARLLELRQRGRNHAAHFTWQRHAVQMASLYEEIVNAHE